MYFLSVKIIVVVVVVVVVVIVFVVFVVEVGGIDIVVVALDIHLSY